jgi:hypothetical protein
MRYDPDRGPDPQAWLALPERERIALVREYHRRARIRVPRPELHAAIQQVVETQVAMGAETPAEVTLHRLMREGLPRHEALHAIGAVLMDDIMRRMKDDDDDPDAANERYFRALRALTVESWHRDFGDEGSGR